MFSSIKEELYRFRNPRYSTAYLAKLAVLTAISYVLYSFVKISLPTIFPSFLDMQISELPALLAGFSMGPVSGCLVIILKCLFKFPFSTTALAGESTDILLGIAFVLPASLIYRSKKDKKHALIGIATGTALLTTASILVNRYISIPFYVELYFGGEFSVIVNMLSALYPAMTEETFYVYYLFLGVLPFNLLRCIIVGAVTFLIYKRLSGILHWDGGSMKQSPLLGEHILNSADATIDLGRRLGAKLKGGETVFLIGDLGAGKTTFTKGIARGLEIKDEILSPTFILMKTYKGRLTLNHIDMYRLDGEVEADGLGLEDVLYNKKEVTVIEWNKLDGIAGKIIVVNFEIIGDSERKITIEKKYVK